MVGRAVRAIGLRATSRGQVASELIAGSNPVKTAIGEGVVAIRYLQRVVAGREVCS